MLQHFGVLPLGFCGYGFRLSDVAKAGLEMVMTQVGRG